MQVGVYGEARGDGSVKRCKVSLIAQYVMSGLNNQETSSTVTKLKSIQDIPSITPITPNKDCFFNSLM